MPSYVQYREIPKPERKQLAAEVRHTSRRVRNTTAAIVVVSIIAGTNLGYFIVPKPASWAIQLISGVLCAVIVFWLLWQAFGAALLRKEVERKRNDSEPGAPVQRP